MRSTDKPSKSVSAIQVDLTALSIFLATQADIVAAYLFGARYAEGLAHELFGLVVFAVALVLLGLIGRGVSRLWPSAR